MQHIEHFEDLALRYPIEFIKPMVDDLRRYLQGSPMACDISIKYDGAPAVVVGFLDGKFFVGTKSFFNKGDKKLCYSYHDILESSFKPEIKRILFTVFDIFYRDRDVLKMYTTNDGALQGDVMWMDKATYEGREYGHENILAYDVTPGRNSRIGLALHTIHRYISTNKLVSGPFTSNIPVLYPSVEQFDVNLRTDPGVSQLHFSFDTIRILTGVGLAKDYFDVAEHRKKINASLRTTGIQPWNPTMKKLDAAGTFLYAQDILREIKRNTLSILNDLTDDKPFLVNHDGTLVPTEHEGYVVHFRNGVSAKLVDRECFSQINFGNKYKRGWTKETNEQAPSE